MKALKTLKNLVNGFRKGGESMDGMADFSALECAVSPLMREKTREWWEVFRGETMRKGSLPVAYSSTAYLARLVTGELKYELADERLNAFAQRNLLPRLDRIVQLALVGGYAVIKPYMTRSGEIFFDVGTSRDFIPVTLDENGQITEGVFSERVKFDGKVYERREWHCFKDGIHIVRNSAFLYGTRQRVELSTIPRWAGLAECGEIPSEIPMIATLRTPFANNIDLDSPLPVSLFANSVGTLREINAAHSEYLAEFKKMRAKVFADETVMRGKDGITDDYFVTVDGDGTSAIGQQILTYAPAIREEAHRAAINTELRLYEVQLGVSCGTFTFDNAKGLMTATQVLSEDRTTYNTVAQLQRQLRPVLEAVADIAANLARFYGFEVAGGKPAVEFGDSVFEDTGTEFDRRFRMVQAGLLKPEEFNAWYFGVPIDKARELIPS